MKQTSIALMVLAAALFGCRPPAEEPVVIRPVRAMKIADTAQLEARWFPGRAQPTQEVNIAFEVAGRVRNRIHAEEARTEQVLRRYEQTVLRALEEVENAVVAYREEQVRRDALERSVTAAAESVELVNTLYRTGLTDFQNVRDMEASLTLQQDAFAESQGRVVQNLIELYRALGGGWEPDPDELVREIEDQKNGEPVL